MLRCAAAAAAVAAEFNDIITRNKLCAAALTTATTYNATGWVGAHSLRGLVTWRFSFKIRLLGRHQLLPSRPFYDDRLSQRRSIQSMRGGQTQEGCPIKKARKAFVDSYREGGFYRRASCTEGECRLYLLSSPQVKSS